MIHVLFNVGLLEQSEQVAQSFVVHRVLREIQRELIAGARELLEAPRISGEEVFDLSAGARAVE